MTPFLSGAAFIVRFQRDLITKVAAQEVPCPRCKGEGTLSITMGDKTERHVNCYRCNGTKLDGKAAEAIKATVSALVAMTEASWLAAQDAAKEREDGNKFGSN